MQTRIKFFPSKLCKTRQQSRCHITFNSETMISNGVSKTQSLKNGSQFCKEELIKKIFQPPPPFHVHVDMPFETPDRNYFQTSLPATTLVPTLLSSSSSSFTVIPTTVPSTSTVILSTTTSTSSLVPHLLSSTTAIPTTLGQERNYY